MRQVYKGHHIEVSTRKEDSGWKASVYVTYHENEKNRFERPPHPAESGR